MAKLDVYPIGDLRIQVALQDRLRRAEHLAGADIDVFVCEGRVTLEGRVFCARDADEAVQAAAETEGVTEVRQSLHVEA
jgi:osmotically-inducible protein OsmY